MYNKHMQKAHDFTLNDQNGKPHSLTDYRGEWLVLYFYPKDDSPGCTVEACAFRDANEALLGRGATVVGISKDSEESHKKFAEKNELQFTLLSDPTKETIKAYGAWGKGFMGHIGTLRQTFIITPNGEIAKSYPRVTPAQHATQIVQDLTALQAGL